MEFNIGLVVYISFVILGIYALYRRNTMRKREKKREVRTEIVELIHKEIIRVSDLEFGYPRYRNSYELTFQLEKKIKTFCVSEFEYPVIEVGDKELLVYTRYELIAFGDKITKNKD